MDLEQLKKDTKEILVDVLEKSRLRQGQILVLGMSSSEVAGGQIGKASNIDLAEAIVQTLLDELNPRGIYLAVQGCEHLNRALVCLLYTSPSPRDMRRSRMPSSA